MIWQWVRKRFKQKLDVVSPSFCLAKYTQTNIHLGTATTHSCHHCPAHSISLDDVKRELGSLHNTREKVSQRTLMLQGEKPNDCSYCWKIENAGGVSDRITKSFSPWSRPYLDKIIEAGPTGIDPSYLEISFDNRCNLKCSYCGPTYSSKWVEEIKRFGPWPDDINSYHIVPTIPHNQPNPYIEAFWEWLPGIYNNLHTLRLTGGEPLLSKNTFKFIDFVREYPNKNLTLGINTNLSVPNDSIDKFINTVKDIKVKNLTIHTSCDTFGRAAEYARHGLNYDEWLNNCRRILKELPNAKLDIMVTYNVFSVTSFLNFLEDINSLRTKTVFKKYKVNLSISYLRDPEHLAVWVLPEEYKKHVAEQISFMKAKNFLSSEVNQLERIEKLFSTHSSSPDLRMKFNKFVQEHDMRRKTSFVDSFPELSKFLDDCK